MPLHGTQCVTKAFASSTSDNVQPRPRILTSASAGQIAATLFGNLGLLKSAENRKRAISYSGLITSVREIFAV